MDGERAEAHLRLLAEGELRRRMALPADTAGFWQSPQLALVAQALCAVGVVDVRVAKQIQSDLDVAVAVRQLGPLAATSRGPGSLPPALRRRLERLVQVPAEGASEAFSGPGLSAGQPISHRALWRVAPVGHVIPRDPGVRGELVLIAFVQTTEGAWFMTAVGMAGRPGLRGSEPGPDPQSRPRLDFRQFTATDDHGASYRFRLAPGFGVGAVELHPDPPRELRWLDLSTTVGEPASRLDLDPQVQAPDVTVSSKATSPGELLLDVIAARILSLVAFSPDNPEQVAAFQPELQAFIADGPGHIVAALYASGALSPASRVPGHLAELCAKAGISGHGITAPPVTDLPERWQSMLTHYHGREPRSDPSPGRWAASVVELPELDGVRLTILGLHHGEPGTVIHMLASGVTLDDDWSYTRGIRLLPVLWIRDSGDRWHATRTNGRRPWRNTGVVMLWLEIVPSLDPGTDWIEVVAMGRSAEVRAKLPLGWS